MPLGMSHSVGEGRVNPESSEAYHSICQMALGDTKYNLMSTTGGCSSYKCRCDRCCVWFEEHHSVNHSWKVWEEFSRPIGAVIADAVTLATRPAKTGTMGASEIGTPKSRTARTPRGTERIDTCVRAQQFRANVCRVKAGRFAWKLARTLTAATKKRAGAHLDEAEADVMEPTLTGYITQLQRLSDAKAARCTQAYRTVESIFCGPLLEVLLEPLDNAIPDTIRR